MTLIGTSYRGFVRMIADYEKPGCRDAAQPRLTARTNRMWETWPCLVSTGLCCSRYAYAGTVIVALMALLSGISAAQTGKGGQNAPPGAPSASTSPETARRPLKPEAQASWDRAQELLFRKHDAEASIVEFKKVLKIDPWYGPAYFLVGLAYMQLQRWGDAQWAFEEATKVEPGNAQAFMGLGSALNEQHDYIAAQKALEHSLELKPDSAEAHYELARTLGASGRWKTAEPHARQAIALNPDYPGPHALMGNVYLDRQDPESALKEFREYLRLAPEGSLAESVKQIVAEIEKAGATKPGH